MPDTIRLFNTLHTAISLFGPNWGQKRFKKQQVVTQNSGEGEARGAPAPHTPHASGAHTHTSGTALEHTLREHPGRQHAVLVGGVEILGSQNGAGSTIGREQ